MLRQLKANRGRAQPSALSAWDELWGRWPLGVAGPQHTGRRGWDAWAERSRARGVPVATPWPALVSLCVCPVRVLCFCWFVCMVCVFLCVFMSVFYEHASLCAPEYVFMCVCVLCWYVWVFVCECVQGRQRCGFLQAAGGKPGFSPSFSSFCSLLSPRVPQASA